MLSQSRHDLSATHQTGATPCILPSSLRASLRLFRIAPGDLVGVDFETCTACGGALRIIARIEDPITIANPITHLGAKGAEPEGTRRPPNRAPP
jgi:hypothetical protein